MSVKKIKIKPNGERLWIRVSFDGLIVASYIYQLFEDGSNDIVQDGRGNNQNPHDDDYKLPLPTKTNIGRLIDVRSRLVGLDTDNYKTYTAKVELFQGNTSLGVVSESGNVTGLSQLAQLYIIIE